MVRTRLAPKVPYGADEGGLNWDDIIVNEVCGPIEFKIKPAIIA